MNAKLLNRKSALALAVLVFFSVNVFSQKAPMKFGKVDPADLAMTVYPSDTSAVAAVLCNYGYFSSNTFNFTRMLRIKIFKKEGTSYGDQVFPLDSKTDIRGVTTNLENGQVVQSKLKSESIFKERVTDDFYNIRVAMPNVKEGSVIDLMFTYEGLPDEWDFQEEIPVRWSELVLEPSQYIDYRKNFTGFVSLSESGDMRWVAKDVPAFKREGYMNSIQNYIAKFDIDLLNISIPGYYREYTTSWEAVNRRLSQNSYFGGTLQGALFLNPIAKEIEAQYSDPMDKIRAAYERVKVVKWNERSELYTTQQNLSYAYNKKIGNSADINLILVQLLKKLDFKAYPVAMSSRANGQLRVYSPSLNKLNYVVACVKLDGKTIVLDATDELIPFGLLPKRALNERGRLIDSDFTDWVEMTTDKKDKEFVQYELTLDTTDVLTGKISTTKADYAAYNYRRAYQKFNGQDEYLKDFEQEHPGLTVNNFTVKNLDSIYNPIQEEYDVKIKNRVSRVGNLIYLNPLFYEQITDNPFKLEERKYPVDFAYPSESTYMLKLTLPAGWQVSERPKPLRMVLQENGAACTYQVSTSGNVVQVVVRFNINRPVFFATEYMDLKALFSEIIKKEAETLVIKSL